MIRHADVNVSARAARQLGLITRAQALEAGLGREQIQRRLASERWVRIAPKVYVINGAPPSWQQLALAWCLSTGGVASHLTAAALWCWIAAPRFPHVVVGRECSARRDGVVIHRSALHPADVTTLGPIAVTTPARTLVDLAALSTDEVTRDVVDRALSDGRPSPARVIELLDRIGSGVPGRSRLAGAIRPWVEPIGPDSPAEARLLRQLDDWGVPTPVRQHELFDGDRFVARIDVAWPSRRLGLEYDGLRWHGPARIERDEDRHQQVSALGWTLLHADRLDLRPGADDLRRRLATALDLPLAS
jgi:hypothetical protein